MSKFLKNTLALKNVMASSTMSELSALQDGWRIRLVNQPCVRQWEKRREEHRTNLVQKELELDPLYGFSMGEEDNRMTW